MYDEERKYQVINDDGTQLQRRRAWETGAGLQAVDNLSPSPTAYRLMEQQIKGRTTYQAVVQELDAKYGKHISDQREADISAVRIAELVNSGGFFLSPSALAATHRRIFANLLPEAWVGKWRTEQIGKPEPVIGGKTVGYSAPFQIEESLEAIFAREDRQPHPFTDQQAIDQVLKFISQVWRVHPFREGNTRTTATFAVLYLKSLGLQMTNQPFADNSVFFRDALVLDNAPDRLRDREPMLRFGAALGGADVSLASLRPETSPADTRPDIETESVEQIWYMPTGDEPEDEDTNSDYDDIGPSF